MTPINSRIEVIRESMFMEQQTAHSFNTVKHLYNLFNTISLPDF